MRPGAVRLGFAVVLLLLHLLREKMKLHMVNHKVNKSLYIFNCGVVLLVVVSFVVSYPRRCLSVLGNAGVAKLVYSLAEGKPDYLEVVS